MRAFKGVYKNGTIEFKEPFSLENGTEVLIIPITTEETNADLSTLLQQVTLKKVWEDEEDLYGEV